MMNSGDAEDLRYMQNVTEVKFKDDLPKLNLIAAFDLFFKKIFKRMKGDRVPEIRKSLRFAFVSEDFLPGSALVYGIDVKNQTQIVFLAKNFLFQALEDIKERVLYESVSLGADPQMRMQSFASSKIFFVTFDKEIDRLSLTAQEPCSAKDRMALVLAQKARIEMRGKRKYE